VASRCRERITRPAFNLAKGGIHAHSRIVPRHFARWLLAFLLLLALLVSEQSSGAMSADMANMQMSDVDQSCKACGGTMAAAPCDAACVALLAIAAAIVALPDDGGHECWSTRSESTASHSISPDTSPPRA
jgi:hypothetical protein